MDALILIGSFIVVCLMGMPVATGQVPVRGDAPGDEHGRHGRSAEDFIPQGHDPAACVAAEEAAKHRPSNNSMGDLTAVRNVAQCK